MTGGKVFRQREPHGRSMEEQGGRHSLWQAVRIGRGGGWPRGKGHWLMCEPEGHRSKVVLVVGVRDM